MFLSCRMVSEDSRRVSEKFQELNYQPIAALQRYLADGWKIRGKLLVATCPYLILAGLFLAFLKVNGAKISPALWGGSLSRCPCVFVPSLSQAAS